MALRERLAQPKLASWAWPEDAGHQSADKALFVARDHVLARLSRTLGEARLDAVLVKGAGMAELYPSAWQRPMTDIDLLVRGADLPAIVGALERAAFRVDAPADRTRTGTLLEVVVFPPADLPELAIELHLGMDKVVLRDLDSEQVFARSTLSRTFAPLRVPALEDHVLLVVLHLGADEFRHATGFVDLEVLLRAGADLDVVVTRAKAMGAEIVLYTALATLARLAPDLRLLPTLSALRPTRLRERLLATRFDVGRWPVAKTARALGAPWLYGQSLLRDDVVAFGRGLLAYAGKRALERAEGLARRAR